MEADERFSCIYFSNRKRMAMYRRKTADQSLQLGWIIVGRTGPFFFAQLQVIFSD
jgi:hypothetical protein